MSIENYVREQLFAMQDRGYHDFHCKLMPTVDEKTVIGVRTPALRKFAKELAQMPEKEDFLQNLPHRYYEENNLHGCLVESMKDYNACMKAVNLFLPYVNNWATCDMMTPKVFGKHLEELEPQITKWLASGDTYTIRFGIRMLMNFYLEEHFALKYPEMVASVHSEEYYVNMMSAWYFATALAKQYEAILPFLEERRLSEWVHNKTIRKAVESYRITKEQKEYLRTLRQTS